MISDHETGALKVRAIETEAEFEALREGSEGFIYNDFAPESPSGRQFNVLHEAGCRELERANTNVPKIHFDALDEAVAWLKTQRGAEHVRWKRCGTCLREADIDRSDDTSGNPELLLAWEQSRDRSALALLQRRGILVGAPANPVGQYARYLANVVLGGERTDDEGRPSYHLVDGDGKRVQVQARHTRDRNPTYFPLNHDPDNRNYDLLLLAVFEPNYRSHEAWLLDWPTAASHAKRASRGWRIYVRGGWRGDARRLELVDPQGV